MTRPDATQDRQPFVAPRLSILDQSPIGEGSTAAEALRASVELAEAADELGVTRYWVAEHHGSPGFAGTAPEILVPVLLGATRRLQVGSGGVLLPRYPVRKVAEVFSILADVYPGRVDLGLGRAGGPAESFPQDVADLKKWFGDDLQLWVLGASGSSAALAATTGTSYAFAHFLNPGPGQESMRAYSNLSPAPNSALSYHSKALIAGTPDRVHPVLMDLARTHDTQELIVNVLTHDPADRLRTYQLLAQLLSGVDDDGGSS
ncbi:MsnO8 family LLM class oxidoreductase [Kribbella sp. NPDC006257]|uniref:MsnO8 family LLM class oxidoreductase n=1 Tax=Kribbella sp. NPDC006257 TaxID=3156738 RepID=UPI0033BCE85C